MLPKPMGEKFLIRNGFLVVLLKARLEVLIGSSVLIKTVKISVYTQINSYFGVMFL